MAAVKLSETLVSKLDYDQLTNCMRCGFCLPACPTFQTTGLEPESPRGRIALMKAVVDGIMEPDESFREQMNHCLGCRACEPACPADVKYGQLIEQARDALEDHPEHGIAVSALRKWLFRHIFPSRNMLKLMGGLLGWCQKTGLNRFARRLGLLKVLPKHLQEMERVLPEASSKGVLERIGSFVYPAEGDPIGRVGMFSGCIMDVLFAETNVNTVKLLAKAGFEVVIPPAQNCCGALHAHSGEMDLARELARSNIRAFKEANVDVIVSNAGGCGALLVEYDHLLKDDPEFQADAAWFAGRVKDVSQLLLEKGRTLQFRLAAEDGKEPEKLTYQDSCHLRNVMKASDAPRTLMQRVKGAEFIEMCGADSCCGSAGIYNVTQPEMAGKILESKMKHADETDAHYLITSNPGCLLQMKLGIEKHQPQVPMKAVHIVDYLHERMEDNDKQQ